MVFNNIVNDPNWLKRDYFNTVQ